MRNISFRRTTNLRLFALIAPVAMLAACGQNDAATDEAAKPADTATAAATGAKTGPTPAATPIAPVGSAGTAELSKVKQEFVKGLTDSCTTSATRSGAPANIASQVCGCVGEELARTKSEAELLTMSPSDAEPVMKACAQKAGLKV